MRGFTLFETLIYISLLAIIMGGTLASVYQLLSGSSATSARNTAQEEGTFVIRKIEWAMNSAKTISIPSATELQVTRYDGISVDIQLASGAVQMSENGGVFRPLTTSNVSVTGLAFTAVGGTPQGVAASTTINSVAFATTKYLPK